jgi:hypothetical protein
MPSGRTSTSRRTETGRWVKAESFTPAQQQKLLDALENFNERREEEGDNKLKRQEFVDWVVETTENTYD